MSLASKATAVSLEFPFENRHLQEYRDGTDSLGFLFVNYVAEAFYTILSEPGLSVLTMTTVLSLCEIKLHGISSFNGAEERARSKRRRDYLTLGK